MSERGHPHRRNERFAYATRKYHASQQRGVSLMNNATMVLRRWGFVVNYDERAAVEALGERYGLEVLEREAKAASRTSTKHTGYVAERLERRLGTSAKSSSENSPDMTAAAAATPVTQPDLCAQLARTAAATRRSPSLAAATTASMNSESSAATTGASHSDGRPWSSSANCSRVAAIWAGSIGVGLAGMACLRRVIRGRDSSRDEAGS